MTIRLCMIGCGNHSSVVHGPAVTRCAREDSGLSLVACCDLDSARAEEYRARFGFERAWTDLARMLDEERPDVVSLVAPVTLTPDLSCVVFERGLPLLLEKPPGRTVAEVDRMVAASIEGGRRVPHQVAFNRRFVPLIRELKRQLAELGAPSSIQHIHYEMVRVNRRDPDFSTTAIHGIDAVRHIAGCDFREIRFRYRECPGEGPGVAHIFLDAVMESGATAHLAFCPMGGVVVERAEVHIRDHTFFLHIPMWAAFDSPGRLQHLERGDLVGEVTGRDVSDGEASWELGGFYAEYVSFLDSIRRGAMPSPTLPETRQSVEVSECIRERREEYGR
jgi:myo-inositol 2-dehydrogenase / D-chiro-inositol 1-dehydrogenase